MLDITEEIPFLWRLSSDKEEGFSHVSMVIPFNSGSENLEHTIQTDIISFMGDNEQLEDEEVLEWNEDDIALFLKLLAVRQAQQRAEAAAAAALSAGEDAVAGDDAERSTDELIDEATAAPQAEASGTDSQAPVPGPGTQTFRVDLSDPETIEIVHIVAAAGFGMALNVDDLLVTDPGDDHRLQTEPEIGARITLHTVDGYKRGVVVGTEDEEIVCVLLDSIKPDKQFALSDIHPHDLVIVQPHQLLPAYYSSREPEPGDVLH